MTIFPSLRDGQSPARGDGGTAGRVAGGFVRFADFCAEASPQMPVYCIRCMEYAKR
jgi:hypothetical protein